MKKIVLQYHSYLEADSEPHVVVTNKNASCLLHWLFMFMLTVTFYRPTKTFNIYLTEH